MKVLVTGCAGFIGSHLSEKLLTTGHTVIGVDNMNQFYNPELKAQNLVDIEKTGERENQEFIFYKNDIRHQDEMEQIMLEHKPDVVVHLAAMAGVRPSLENPLLYVEVNELGTLTLLEAARKAGVKRIVFASSSSVYGNNEKTPFQEIDTVDRPISPYAATKKSGELYCHIYHKLYGMSVACLRFFTVYGPRQRPDLAINKFTKLMSEGKKLPVYGDGTKSRDFTFIDDIVGGIQGAINWTSSAEPVYDIFNLGESETTDVNGLIQGLEKAMDQKADVQYLPEVPGDVQTTFADTTKAREVLGYAPKTKINEGLQKYVDWVKERKML